MFDKLRMFGEIIVLAMFQDQESFFFQKFVLKDQVRDFRQIGKGIGWICKDKIELFLAFGYKFEDISSYRKSMWIL